jgi:DoxX-like family
MAIGVSVKADADAAPASKVGLWAGRVLTALPVLFLLFDGVAKVMKVAPVMEASARLEIPGDVIPGLGAVLIAATLVYAFPRTSLLGAIVLTGYLGGAICAHLRAGDPAFPTVFPGLVAAMVWGGLYLREPRLRALIPVRR